MALAVANVASTSTSSDATTYNLSSVNIDKNVLYLYTIEYSKATAPDLSAISGLAGATWEIVQDVPFNTTGTPLRRLVTWRTMVGTSANAVTLTASFGGGTQTGFVGILDVVTGCATSDSNGAGAVRQSTYAATTSASLSLTVTLATTPTDSVYSAWGKQLNSGIGDPAGFVVLADLGAATPAQRAQTAWSSTPVASAASTQPVAAQIAGILFELVTTTGAPASTHRFPLRTLLGMGV